MVVHFVWQIGSNHAEAHEKELTCPCGRRLVYGDLEDPFRAETQE